ncbi:MAG: DUF3822 family protein [Crocinitomicaceae bacterium]|nr:DUF3822 family protein [Crocinitomicaceae bacterium]
MAHTHLAIDINTSAVRFVKLNGDFIVDEKSFVFTDKQDYRYKNQLEEFWSNTGWKESDFEKVSLSWSEKYCTIVPANVYNESSKNALFSLSFGTIFSIDEIDYNRLPMQGMVSVFAIPSWVKSFFVIRFPRIVIQHEGTHLIRGVFEGQTFKLKTKIVLHKEHFTLVIVKENKLQFYSSFDYSSLEDVVYYFSFTMQQLGLNQQANEVELIEGAGSEVAIHQLIEMLQTIGGSDLVVKNNQFLIEKYQLTCV